MTWLKKLVELEHNKKWDEAILLLENIINNNSNDMQAYIQMNYLFMNLLVEEKFDFSKAPYYQSIARKYFNKSYKKFSNNAEYLYFSGISVIIAPWHFKMTHDQAEFMLEKAMKLDPENLIYQRSNYIKLRLSIPEQRLKILEYTSIILDNSSFVNKILKNKGIIGEYLLELTSYWNKQAQGIIPFYSNE